jgi:hypothetical protein
VFCGGEEEDTEGTIHHGEGEITEILGKTPGTVNAKR